MKAFLIIFISIILEAMPFVLLGALVSACIGLFVSESLIEKILPKRRWIGFIVAALLGIVFPVCECAIIPITRRLIKKGVPIGMGMTFMLAVPIVNPVVLLSTYYAFNDRLYMLYARAGFGFLAAVAVGVLISISEGSSKPVLKDETVTDEVLCACGCQEIYRGYGAPSYIRSILEHTSKEFLNIIKYLVIGASLSALFQTYVDKDIMRFIGSHSYLAILFMMALAFVLSVCSEVDAFIARSFIMQFSSGSILAFLVFGPMLDIKNMLMLMGHFKTRFVIKVAVYITLISALIGFIANLFI
ncbi:permease [Cellulosilyticum sp. I15G10I2]|uniref:permease n=1 Tax=Cellulosilyticum sp. I15G10I2 TaxID=1892843 RepID=UPI00085CD419|nr:permease [Cellulosilyticum sp. I15G10I2]